MAPTNFRPSGNNQLMARRVIVVPAAAISDSQLRASVRAHAGDDAEIYVVAPASKISRLDWLTNAEDDARAEAAHRAEKTAEAAPTDNVEAHVGDSDPLQAIEDALRTFPADEVIVVTPPDESATWLEAGAGEEARRRFALPVTHLIARDPQDGTTAQRKAAGRTDGGAPARKS